jgi:ubiquinone/menaquinone biosynthesis C-methylase UbiE
MSHPAGAMAVHQFHSRAEGNRNEVSVSAPCLESGPISQAARSAVDASEQLGQSSAASILRVWGVPFLFQRMEKAFASGQEPVAEINAALNALSAFYAAAHTGGIVEGPEYRGADSSDEPELPVEVRTGRHYGELFKAFADTSFWDEPKRLLQARLDRNEIQIDDLGGKSVLDAGCGGGRYTVAWKLLGARRAVGIDVSDININDADRRVREAQITDVEFRQGTVLALPVEDDSFDIVYSNGVLHHTTDWRAGLNELLRAMKPGGLGFLYLIENPGGLFWDVIEILRVITQSTDGALARQALRQIGIPANRIFYMLDHVMAPINIRLTPGEIEEGLQQAGASGIRRLTRGTDFDRIERIFQGDPFATVKYGVGENRYVFSKT